MRRRFRRLRRIIAWGTLLLLAIAAGGLAFAYYYVTDSAVLAALIRQELPRYLPETQTELAKVVVRPLMGDIELRQVAVWQTLDGRPFLVFQAPYLKVSQSAQSLLDGEFQPREVAVAMPVLRLTRRKDGRCNLQGLLADPWPAPPISQAPVISIKHGRVEIHDEAAEPPLTTVLRDVAITIEPTETPYLVSFKGFAKGEDVFDRVHLEGSYDLQTGRVELRRGDLSRLSIAATLRRLPEDYRQWVSQTQITGGDVDLTDTRLTFDPTADPPLRYATRLKLHDGSVAAAPALPFALENLTAEAILAEGLLGIERARGTHGKTVARLAGTVPLDPQAAGLDVTLQVDELELDDHLRAWTPERFAPLWNEFRPSGRLDVVVRARRDVMGGPIRLSSQATCRDVAMVFHLFPYPVEHLWGRLEIEPDRIEVDVSTTIGGRPATCKGSIFDPGPDPHVVLDFAAEALPIDEVLLSAMPVETRAVIDQFQPTGTVRGTARVERTQRTPADPDGKLAITADLSLEDKGRCAIVWAGLPYPITNLTGTLKLRPDHWIFEDMRGRNGVATIRGHGRVDHRPDHQWKVDLTLFAEDLPFDQQLRQALPENWQKTWEVLNPVGSSRLAARIRAEPGQPSHTHLEIVPGPETRVQLKFTPVGGPRAGASGRPLELPPMEQVDGRFAFDDGLVTMSNVSFRFRGSPVRFQAGRVRLEDDGRFDLRAVGLNVRDFRLDAGLRQLMPGLMAQFAQRLDEGRTLTMKADLALGWSGRAGEPTWCSWENGLIVFTGNTIHAGLPLEHLQGQIDHLSGRFDGFNLATRGQLDLASVSVHNLQITGLRGHLDIAHGQARITELQGQLLGGSLTGWVAVDLDATPKYATTLALDGADLRHFTRTMPGKQELRGRASGRIALEGVGSDLKTLQGNGEAHVMEADLGELPVALRLFKFLQLQTPLRLSASPKTAFDAADVRFRIEDGRGLIDPIQLTGDAFSLHGRGTVEPTGDLDLRLRVLYGRDRFHLGRISDLLRETSGQFFDIRVTGPPASPRFQMQALPSASEVVRRTVTRPFDPDRDRDRDRPRAIELPALPRLR